MDFELRYENNVQSGVATVKVLGIGSYKGTASRTFGIVSAYVLAGANRNETAALVADENFASGANGVILATNGSFADALASASLAGAMDYPLLLTARDKLPGATAAAISYLSAGSPGFKVIIIGGTNAVSPAVESEVKALIGDKGFRVSRITGSTRYETASMIYSLNADTIDWSDTAIIASGTNFPDALSASSFAAYARAPIFLTNGQTLDESTTAALGSGAFRRVVIVGGNAAVSSSVERAVLMMPGVAKVERIAGSTRYETSLKIARWSMKQGLEAHCVYVASGKKFPDGLAGGIAAGQRGGVLVIASDADQTALGLLKEQSKDVISLCFVGGTSALPASLRWHALDQMGWDHGMLR